MDVNARLMLGYAPGDLAGAVAGIFDSLFQGDEARTDSAAMVAAIRQVVSLFAERGLTADAERIRAAAKASFDRAASFGERISAERVEPGGGEAAQENDASAKAVASFERLEPGEWRDRDFVPDAEGGLAEELQRVTRWTSRIPRYLELEVDAPTGILFVGKPGTGKTVAAHKVAAANGKRLIVGRHDAIQHHLLGQNMKNLRALFEAAEREDAYIFFDEIDGLARDRKLAGPTDAHRIELLESFLEQLSIMKRRRPEQVIFAATNMPETLDPAFVRRMAITVEFGFLSAPARRALVTALYTRVGAEEAAVDLMVERGAEKSADYLRSVAMAAARFAIDDMVDGGEALVTREHVGAAIKIIRDKHEAKTTRGAGGVHILGR